MKSILRVCGPLGFAVAIVSGASGAWGGLWASSAGGSVGRVSLSVVHPATGAASGLFGIMGGSGSGVRDLAGDPFWQGASLWGVRSAFNINYLAAWNPATASFISEAPINLAPLVHTLAIDPTDGRFYATTDASLYTLDPQTGSAVLVGPTTGMTVNKSLSFDGSGQLYGVGMENKLVAIDKTSGATSSVGTMALYRIEGMAWRSETDMMMGVGYGYGSVNYALFEINLASGAVVNLGVSLTRPSGLAFTGLAADFDSDGTVAQADFEIWRTHAGTSGTPEHGDANGDGAINGADYLAWQRQLGSTIVPPMAVAIPEPHGVGLLAVAVLVVRRRR